MDDGDRLTVFSITELYILKCLQRHIKCYVNFTVKRKKEKRKKICTYDSLIQLGPGLQSLVWGCDSDETRAALKRQHITPNRSSKETGESA